MSMFKIKRKGKTRGRPSKQEKILQSIVNNVANTEEFKKEFHQKCLEMVLFGSTKIGNRTFKNDQD